jgi:RNA polymerase sigma-70 factor, ECF subfamily
LRDDKEIVRKCLQGDAAAYEALYEQFAPKMLVVCNRYVRVRAEAEDLLQEGFIKIFEQLPNFRGDGSFEGWIRRIMVNNALDYYRHQTTVGIPTYNLEEINDYSHPVSSEEILSQIASHDLLQMVQQLPPAYRMVFNLYVFEGLKHREIAEQLSISEGTSKSNLADARVILQKKVKESMLEAKKRL